MYHEFQILHCWIKLKNDLSSDTVYLRVRCILILLLFQNCDLAQTGTSKRIDGNNRWKRYSW